VKQTTKSKGKKINKRGKPKKEGEEVLVGLVSIEVAMEPC